MLSPFYGHQSAICSTILIPEKKKKVEKRNWALLHLLLFVYPSCCPYLLFEGVAKFPKGKAVSDRKETCIRNKWKTNTMSLTCGI